jgi:hypothetical protein
VAKVSLFHMMMGNPPLQQVFELWVKPAISEPKYHPIAEFIFH